MPATRNTTDLNNDYTCLNIVIIFLLGLNNKYYIKILCIVQFNHLD